MKSKISLKWSLFIVSSAVIGFSSIAVFSPALNPSAQGSYLKSTGSTQVVASQKQENPAVSQKKSELPSRLMIPKIKINTALESVGITREGAMGVPKGLANAAWFNLGPRPGDNGSAVIDGHYGFWKNGTLGVFNNLSKLRKGDKLYVKDKKGATITFIVREARTYGENDDATTVFTSSDGKAHLNLITCEGILDKISKSYPKRLVVFADKE